MYIRVHEDHEQIFDDAMDKRRRFSPLLSILASGIASFAYRFEQGQGC